MSETQAYYERYWADPDRAPPAQDPTTADRKNMLRAALRPLPAGAKILDVGCGTGGFTEFFAELGFSPVGIDISEAAVRVAQQKYPKREFHIGTPDSGKEQWTGTFHAVWCSEVIEHVFDVHGFLTGLHRVLKPGGLLILTTPYHGVVKNLLISLTSSGYAIHCNPFGGHIRFFNRSSLDRCLRHCGLTVRGWRGFGRMWPIYKSFFVIAQRTHDSEPAPETDW